jgi:hypothetical protein
MFVIETKLLVLYGLFVFVLYLMLHVACDTGLSIMIAPSGVTVLYCALLVWVLYLVFHVAFVSGSSTLVCPFRGYFVVLCFACLRSVSYAPLLIAPLVYCVALCFDCLLSVYYAPYCMCHWVVHSCLPL